MPEDRLPDFNRYPMLWLAVALSCGILFSNYTSINPLASAGVSIVLTVIAALLNRNQYSVYVMLFAFAAAGVTLLSAQKISVAENRIVTLIEHGIVASGSHVEVEGVVRRPPEAFTDGEFVELSSEKLTQKGIERDVSGNLRLFLPLSAETGTDDYEVPPLKYGSRIRVICRIARDDGFLNPGVIPRKQLLDRLNIDATCSVKSRLLVERIADESVFMPLAWVYDQRSRLIDELRYNLDQRTAGVMIASLLGNKYFLDKGTADLFREGGTFHILVISGLHITFIGGLLLLFIRSFTRNRWLQFGVTMAIMWAYTLAVGAEVPVVRASIMFTIVLFSYAIYRQGSLINSLGVCAMVLLVWRPVDLLDASFQLTFVSVGAIIAGAYPLIEKLREIGSWMPSASAPFPPNAPRWLLRFCETLYWNPDVWSIERKRQIWTAGVFKEPYFQRVGNGMLRRSIRYLFEGILVSLIVQIWMLPLTVVYFHRISIASVLLNLWVGVLIAVQSFAAVAGVLFARFSEFLARPFFAIAELTNLVMLSLPQLLAEGGWASFRLPVYSGWGALVYFIYFVPIAVLVVRLNRWSPFVLLSARKKGSFLIASLAAVVLVAIGLTIVVHPFSISRPDGRLHVEFLDVGQGDSALVTFPDGQTMLVDGGGRFRYETAKNRDMFEAEPFEPDVRGIGEAVVSEVLWYKGISRIDHVVATHADADHIQGLTDVVKNLQVGTALIAGRPMDDPDFAAFSDALRRRGVAEEIVSRGDVFKVGDVTVEVLSPVAVGGELEKENDRSIVLRLVMGSRSFLLTGDVEARAERILTSGGGTLRADVVKVPHHGSRTSSTEEFVAAVGAAYAVVPVGRYSMFGHPHEEVLERWRAAGAAVMTTGERGMISFSTDGHEIWMQTFLP
ncbi:MAG: ComEC/Rec2 family competence protein [Pyrinomonadaceae bacterium]|nr:ComEC/Rec2 family competence protein [Pyrinomonadaceae bacterium]